MQGEQGGLFGLRRIGKTSVLNLLRLRIEKENGAAIYFDCSQYHHNRWNEFLEQIIKQIEEKYSDTSHEENKLSQLKNTLKINLSMIKV
jgi:predicted AAA+ superfamily ATPase